MTRSPSHSRFYRQRQDQRRRKKANTALSPMEPSGQTNIEGAEERKLGDVMRTAKPALNIYTVPNSGFEFAFHTEDGKISAVISVARPARADIRTIAEKEREALLKLKRLAKALDHAVAEMILS